MDSEYLLDYAPSHSALNEMMPNIRGAIHDRLPGPDVTAMSTAAGQPQKLPQAPTNPPPLKPAKTAMAK